MLVNMPWASLDTPSLALGILHAVVRPHVDDVITLCANVDFYDWAEQTVDLTVDDYEYFAHHAYFEGFGDWVFSSALYDAPDWRTREFHEEMAAGVTDQLRKASLRLHDLAPRFVAELAARIVEASPDVVGFTTTFQQNTAALATARQIKLLAPDTVTVFGGANCDGPQGEALHRNFPFVDHVVRGEAEDAFPALLEGLRGHADVAEIPGLCWRTEAGEPRVTGMSAAPRSADRMAEPDFDAYFHRIERSSARPYIEPKLVLEGSRGCWWGEKHHCTFCGLNGSSMQFRSKEPVDFLNSIVHQSRRHQVLDILVVDNILDMRYIHSLLPELAGLGYDYRFHYEIKSNLHHRQLKTIAEAGLVQVQPGIESLSSRVLHLMRKGVTGCQNVRHLRDTQSAGVWPVWNYLYGFPGETEADYTSVIRQMPALHHLPPPEAATRIAIERFSPYFDRPELGFADLRPAAHYAHIYDLPESELHDLAYLFEAKHAGVDGVVVERLADAVAEWRAVHASCRLTHHDLGDRMVLTSRRPHFDWTVRTIDDPVELAAFHLLGNPRSVGSLARRLTASLGTPVPEAHVRRILADWREAGIVFEDADRFVHVAPLAANTELNRIEPSAPDLTQEFRRAEAPAARDMR
ncbi:RiPP maturation radical SAM C-methyltransferase [Streptomyces apocyni]|uniref:RiPP maturation radical SAM C-methyltransferase n=1 Tax=Streptomyces apocyni TaxID=2654677 RepID=UPI001E5C1F73|nr:RiPP maturation radical SAM C-methyltransferase [Streptomyces apocyni]